MKYVTFLYPLKRHQKTARLSDVFRGYRNVTLGRNGLIGNRKKKEKMSSHKKNMKFFEENKKF